LLLLFSFSVIAQENKVYHLKLLAVQDNGKTIEGSDADLYLELKEGSGRVFLETFPLTKFDTQISTRFAKDIACKQFKLDCNQYDFIFTIKAKSNIVAGPSAGAAIAALTTIAVLDLNYDQSVAITGTINSGGLIGPVGGVKEKLEAAAASGLKKVLISTGTGRQNVSFNNHNKTLIEYGENDLGLEVVEVLELNEVIEEITGVRLNHQEIIIAENAEYTTIMDQLQQMLCTRSTEIKSELLTKKVSWNDIRETVVRNELLAENATAVRDYYSAASYCFSNNILLRTKLYEGRNLTSEELSFKFSKLEIDTANLEKEVDAEEIKTISDLQTFMIVKERLSDVKDQIKKYHDGEQKKEELYGLLGFAEERFFSAYAWKQFFMMTGKEFILDQSVLENSCIRKIAESEERLQYATLFLPNFPFTIDDKIATAQEALQQKQFSLCLITAAQAKAEANAILTVLGLTDEIMEDYLQVLNTAVERIIAENSADGVFPILGYSYYQYSNSLREDEKFTSLLYLEYALEMSELEIYFPEKKNFLPQKYHIKDEIFIFIAGFIVGIIAIMMIQENRKHQLPAKKRKIVHQDVVTIEKLNDSKNN
ncbi:MAG: S16 family serine protease, partial [Nanoarchaeota archaeon]|nr:S16 family serine protease [Nanoarchaeota archaeon]